MYILDADEPEEEVKAATLTFMQALLKEMLEGLCNNTIAEE